MHDAGMDHQMCSEVLLYRSQMSNLARATGGLCLLFTIVRSQGGIYITKGG